MEELCHVSPCRRVFEQAFHSANVPASSQIRTSSSCGRRSALSAGPALEVVAPLYATARGVDGPARRCDAVVLVPGRRLLAANVHCEGRGGLPGSGVREKLDKGTGAGEK